LAVLLLSLGVACSTAPESKEGKADLEARAASALTIAERADPTLGPMLRNMAGYAVFPQVNKGGIGIGGAYGKGVLYEKGVVVGYCDVSQQTIGAQIGGQSYTEIIALQSTDALDRVKAGRFSFDAQASAVAVNAGSRAAARFTNGIAVFTTDERGMMAEASIGTQQLSYEAK